MPEPSILRFEEIPVVDRGGGVRTTPLVTKGIGGEVFLSGITEFPPGSGIPLHFHNCEESVVIIEGEARCEIGGQQYSLKAPDATWVPAGIPHRFWNDSGSRMRFVWTYSSVAATRTLVATGQTFAIGTSEDRVGQSISS